MAAEPDPVDAVAVDFSIAVLHEFEDVYLVAVRGLAQVFPDEDVAAGVVVGIVVPAHPFVRAAAHPSAMKARISALPRRAPSARCMMTGTSGDQFLELVLDVLVAGEVGQAGEQMVCASGQLSRRQGDIFRVVARIGRLWAEGEALATAGNGDSVAATVEGDNQATAAARVVVARVGEWYRQTG